MKIIHLISSPASGGAEIYVKDLAISMATEGHDVHIIFLCRAAEIGRDLNFEKKFLSELTENNISFSFIGNSARKNPMLGIYKTRKIIKKIKPSIIHCHLYYAAIFCLFSAPRNSNLIYTHHNILIGAPSAIYKLLDIRFKIYVGICDACTKMLLKLTRRTVVRIDNAVNTLKLKPLIKEKNKQGAVKIISVGRLTEAKNYPLLLNAVSKIKHLDFTLEIAGEGPDKVKIQELLRNLGLQEKVKLLGAVSDIPERLAAADIFAMSSSWEGLPVSLIEATLSGLPVIVTNVGGCAEVVEHCKNGFSVPPDDITNYSTILTRLIESKKLRLDLSNNAINLSGIYRIENAAKEHLKLYKNTAIRDH